MKLQKEHISYIKDAFNKMKSKEEFLALLNYTKIVLNDKKTIPFALKNVTYNMRVDQNRYFSFSIKKKSGSERILHAPSNGLKSIQKSLNLIFQTVYDVNIAAKGFVPERSIVDNAKLHSGSLYVYNIDLKDFFPSIEAGRIWARLQHSPFNLNENTGRKELANIITWLCTHNMEVERLIENKEWKKVNRNVLPQGAPTSPTLSNIICQQLDFYLSAVAKRFGLRYSRYADDITFSSMHNVYQKNSEFLKEIQRIIAGQSFHINESKTRLQKQGHRQEVTGLLVNETPNVQKRYIKQLRMWLYYWEAYGYEKANSYFLPQYKADKGYVKKGTPNIVNVIAGKLDFLKMVKGGDNKLYLKLKERFDNVASKLSVIENVLDIWEKEGIENAIQKYYGLKASELNKSETKKSKPIAKDPPKTPLYSLEFNEYMKSIGAATFNITRNTVILFDQNNIKIKTIYVSKNSLYKLNSESLSELSDENIARLEEARDNFIGKIVGFDYWIVIENGYGNKDWIYYTVIKLEL